MSQGKKITIRIKGFRGITRNTVEIETDEGDSIRRIINLLTTKIGFNIDASEILVVCNNTMLYLDDSIPKECNQIEIYPLALGG
ncbi:MAG: hypothetical protein JHC33_00290 [Ignisphaera sp.]|nr:hypothetical protein [Ignisphaera sp.]